MTIFTRSWYGENYIPLAWQVVPYWPGLLSPITPPIDPPPIDPPPIEPPDTGGGLPPPPPDHHWHSEPILDGRAWISELEEDK